MAEVVDFDGDVDARVRIPVGTRFHVLDVGVDVGDLRADRGKQTPPVLDFHRQLHRVAYLRPGASGLVPLDSNATLRVVQQIQHVRAGRGVHGHAFAARDVTDDLLPSNGVAAPG